MTHFLTNNGYIEVKITPEIITRAKYFKDNYSFVNDKSFLKGRGLWFGYVGEAVFETVFPIAKKEISYKYDFIINDSFWDIKTKTCYKYPVEDREECSIPNYTFLQSDFPDKMFYGFVFLKDKNILDTAWVTGFLSRKDYYDKSILKKKGDVEKSWNDHQSFIYYEDKRNLPLKNLKSFSKIYNKIWKNNNEV